LPQPDRYVSVKVECPSGHPHMYCVPITQQQVPAELRCEPSAPAGYSSGGGGCQIPNAGELVTLTERDSGTTFKTLSGRDTC
jgi:hypothetical protein